jgi:hypothetical protein
MNEHGVGQACALDLERRSIAVELRALRRRKLNRRRARFSSK